MADAWGGAWGDAWGDAWGADGVQSIAGTSAGTSADTAALTAAASVSATSAGTSTDTAAITGTQTPITGTSAGTSTDTAGVVADASLSGTSAGSSADTAAISGTLFEGALQIDGVTIPVTPGTHSAQGRPFVEATQSQAGHWISKRTHHPGRNKGTVWGQPLEIPMTDLATAETYGDVLKTHGQKTANGYLVGGAPVQVYVRDLEPVWGTTTLDKGWRFSLHKAVP